MLALEGVSATLAIMKDAQQADIPRLIDKAKGYTEEAQDALTTIQFHLGLLR
jgi:hypothetical protein